MTDIKVIISSPVVNTQTDRQKVHVWLDIRHQVLFCSRHNYNLGSKMVCKTAKNIKFNTSKQVFKLHVQLFCMPGSEGL